MATSIEDASAAQLDAIVILSPHYLHASQAMSALQQGFSVLCEKPLATNILEAYQAIALAVQLQRTLRVAMHCRFRPEIEFLYKQIDGPVVRFEHHYLEDWTRASPWFFSPTMSGGGVLLDVGINQIDWLLPLLDGLTPTKAAFVFDGKAVEQEAVIDWAWATGRGTMNLSWQARPERKITIVETARGTRFELNHEKHSILINDISQGSWTSMEYECVLGSFVNDLALPPSPDIMALRVLQLCRDVYKLSGLPFLDDNAGSSVR